MIAGLVVEMGRCIVGEAARRRKKGAQYRHMIGVFHLWFLRLCCHTGVGQSIVSFLD